MIANALPDSMTAYRLIPGTPEPVRQTIPVPSIATDEVLVKVLAAGVCHSDIGFLDPASELSKKMTYAFTLGHEGAGTVVALGPTVSTTHPEIKEGSYVSIFGANSCFEADCPACSSGHDNVCRSQRGIGLGTNGSWAEYIAVRAACIVLVPAGQDTISPAVAAIATDAVLTPYHTMKTLTPIHPGQTVLCVGVGGLGLNAISIAKHCLEAGCVVACDMRQSSLAQALEVGADHAVTPGELVEYLAERKILPEKVFDFVGTPTTFQLCFAAAKHGGEIHVIGLSGRAIPFAPLEMMWKDITVRSSFWGTRSELVEVLQAIKEGKVKPRVQLKPMSECTQVLKDLHDGRLQTRVALVP